MAVDYRITVDNTSSDNVSDLTDTDINPGAAPTSTPRQGGFTLRNRVNFSNVPASDNKLFTLTGGTAATTGRLLRVLEVPKRTLINCVSVFAVEGETVPGTVIVGSSGGIHASALDTAAIGLGVEQRSVPENDDSYDADAHLDIQLTAQDGMGAGAQFGEFALEAAGASVDGCGFSSAQIEAIDGSMTAPELGRGVTQVSGTGSAIYYSAPAYFPHGGFVYLGMTDVVTGSNSDTSSGKGTGTYLKALGTWDFQASCNYVPE
jgi:hypothetical protein